MDVSTYVVSGGPLYSYDPAHERWARFDGMVVRDGRVVSLRPGDAGAGVARVDLGGRAVYPAFADCHVHLTDTGLFLGEHDLAACATPRRSPAASRRCPAPPSCSAATTTSRRGPTARSRAPRRSTRTSPALFAMAVRADGHSCVLNRKAFAFADLPPQTPGIERDADGVPTGRLSSKRTGARSPRY